MQKNLLQWDPYTHLIKLKPSKIYFIFSNRNRKIDYKLQVADIFSITLIFINYINIILLIIIIQNFPDELRFIFLYITQDHMVHSGYPQAAN